MNFCLYYPEKEENLFIQKRAKTWQRSGLISKDQFKIIEERTPSQLVETSLFFRILYFIFTWICLGATIGLVGWMLDLHDEGSFGFLFLLCSIPAYILAEYLVRRHHFYRYGIEEALALSSLCLFCYGIASLVSSRPAHPDNRQMTLLVASLICVYSSWLYLRFGFLYAALISIIAFCFFPFQFSLTSFWERIFVILILVILFLVSRLTESEMLEDFLKKRKNIIQTLLFSGIYLTINLRIFEVIETWFDRIPPYLIPYAGFPAGFYCATYLLIFILPALGLYLGIQARKRAMMNMAGIALAVSLATNKDYLGLKHYPWDPMVFGLTLILGAVLVIRWLAKGQNRERYGFTAESILKPEQYGLSLAEIGAAALPGVTTATGETAPESPSLFEGGQSGGGGASRSF